MHPDNQTFTIAMRVKLLFLPNDVASKLLGNMHDSSWICKNNFGFFFENAQTADQETEAFPDPYRPVLFLSRGI